MSKGKGQLGMCKLRNSPSSDTAIFEPKQPEQRDIMGHQGPLLDSQEEASLREQRQVWGKEYLRPILTKLKNKNKPEKIKLL